MFCVVSPGEITCCSPSIWTSLHSLSVYLCWVFFQWTLCWGICCWGVGRNLLIFLWPPACWFQVETFYGFLSKLFMEETWTRVVKISKPIYQVLLVHVCSNILHKWNNLLLYSVQWVLYLSEFCGCSWKFPVLLSLRCYWRVKIFQDILCGLLWVIWR